MAGKSQSQALNLNFLALDLCSQLLFSALKDSNTLFKAIDKSINTVCIEFLVKSLNFEDQNH